MDHVSQIDVRQNHVHQVRSFNRTVTQRIGVLTDDFLERGRPLGRRGCSTRSVAAAPMCATCGPGSNSIPAM
jgi:hypothetical protein